MNILSIYGLPIVFAFVAIEFLISFFLNDGKYETKETVANISVGVISKLLSGLLWNGLAYFLYSWAQAHALFHFEMNSVLAWTAIVLLVDFAWYFEHRVGHESRLGWSVHSVHHSSEKYNYTVALRLPWFGPLMRIPFLLPLAFAGFSPVAILTGYSAVFIYQIWIHTEYIGKMGVLDLIFNTPSNHRAHHGSNKIYHDKNYGGILIVWDRLFGTYQPETENVKYGISEPIETYNPVKINLKALAELFSAMGKARTVREFFLLPIKRPGTTQF